MSMFAYLRSLLFRSSLKWLIDASRELGRQILVEKECEEAMTDANKQGIDIYGRKRWDACRELIRIHEMCDDQLRHLDDCRKLVRRTMRVKLQDEDMNRLIQSFGPLVPESATVDQLNIAIKERRCK